MIGIGQRVRIKDWDVLVEEFGMYDEHVIDCDFYFPDSLMFLCGVEFTVTAIEERPFRCRGLDFSEMIEIYKGLTYNDVKDYYEKIDEPMPEILELIGAEQIENIYIPLDVIEKVV